jgi:hypothetical protein
MLTDMPAPMIATSSADCVTIEALGIAFIVVQFPCCDRICPSKCIRNKLKAKREGSLQEEKCAGFGKTLIQKLWSVRVPLMSNSCPRRFSSRVILFGFDGLILKTLSVSST